MFVGAFLFCVISRLMHEDVNIPPKRQRTQEQRYSPDGDDDRMEQCPAPPQQSLFGINMQELDAIIGGRADEEFPIASEDEDGASAAASSSADSRGARVADALMTTPAPPRGRTIESGRRRRQSRSSSQGTKRSLSSNGSYMPRHQPVQSVDGSAQSDPMGHVNSSVHITPGVSSSGKRTELSFDFVPSEQDILMFENGTEDEVANPAMKKSRLGAPVADDFGLAAAGEQPIPPGHQPPLLHGPATAPPLQEPAIPWSPAAPVVPAQAFPVLPPQQLQGPFGPFNDPQVGVHQVMTDPSNIFNQTPEGYSWDPFTQQWVPLQGSVASTLRSHQMQYAGSTPEPIASVPLVPAGFGVSSQVLDSASNPQLSESAHLRHK